MADNITLNTGSGGAVLAADDVASVWYQRVKLVDGTADSTAAIAGDATNGLDVDVTRMAALVTGSATIGAVTGPTADNAANPTLKLSTLPAVALAVAPTRTEGNVNPLRVNLAGDVAVTLDAEAVVLGAGTAEIGKLAAGTAAIGKLAANSGVDIGDVDVLTLPNVTLAAGTNTNEVVGDAAHDAAVAGNPVLMGARANANEPAAVSADGDATSLWADLLGRLVVIVGHPNPEPPVTANGSAAGLSVIAAPGASISIYVCKGTVHNRAATETVVSLRDGAAGTIRWTANLAVDGGGSVFDFGSRGWKLTANTALVADIGQASVDVNITEYYLAA